MSNNKTLKEIAETELKTIQGKEYKQYRNNEYNPDNIIQTLKSRTYNCSDRSER